MRRMDNEFQIVSTETTDTEGSGDRRGVEREEEEVVETELKRIVAAESLIEQPSPAPAVVQGGENEFVKVSHLASIEVREVAQKQPPVVTRRTILPTQPQNNTNPDQKMSARELSSLSYSRVPTRRQQINISNDNPEAAEEYNDDRSHDDSDAGRPVERIEKSPYENNFDAERYEKLFDDIMMVLREVKTEEEDGGIVNSRAEKMFGLRNALCLIRTNQLVDKSGMSYSQDWVSGKVRGIVVGKIPPELLLLCLVPQRFIKANDLILSGLCRDLELYKIVNAAIDEFGLQRRYKVVCYGLFFVSFVSFILLTCNFSH